MTDIIHDPELFAAGHDPVVVQPQDMGLPELAETYEEAQARVLADQYLRALRAVQDEADANAAELRQTITFYQARHEERQAVLERREGWLVTQLRTLFGFLPLRGKAKSVNLLAGRLGTKKHPGRLRIVDEELVLAWAKATAPALVTTPPVKERVLVTDLGKWIESIQVAGGREPALPPGVEREDDREDFFADPVPDPNSGELA